MSKHTVKLHSWRFGKLKVVERTFESIHDALNFARHNYGHGIKIYNEENTLVHSAGDVPPENTDSYA